MMTRGPNLGEGCRVVSNHCWSVMQDHCYLLLCPLLQGQLRCHSLCWD